MTINAREYANKCTIYTDAETGMAHRDDGPAVDWGDMGGFWYKDGKLHRLDGPAILLRSTEPDSDGDEQSKEKLKCEWWFNGRQVRRDLIKKNFNDPANPEDSELVMFKMTVVSALSDDQLYEEKIL